LVQQDIASPPRVERAQAKLSFKERLHSQSSPPTLPPSWLREAPRSGLLKAAQA